VSKLERNIFDRNTR